MGNSLFNVQVLIPLKLVGSTHAVLSRSRLQTICLSQRKRTLRLHLKNLHQEGEEIQWAAQITAPNGSVRTDVNLGLSGSSGDECALFAVTGEHSLVLPRKIFSSTPGSLSAESNSAHGMGGVGSSLYTIRFDSNSNSCSPCMPSCPALDIRQPAANGVNALSNFILKAHAKRARNLDGQHKSRPQAGLCGLTRNSAYHAVVTM